jgi:hypothetical protein
MRAEPGEGRQGLIANRERVARGAIAGGPGGESELEGNGAKRPWA